MNILNDNLYMVSLNIRSDVYEERDKRLHSFVAFSYSEDHRFLEYTSSFTANLKFD